MARRIKIIQDPEILIDEYYHRLNYDNKDTMFMRYFRERTGIQIKPGEYPDAYDSPEEQFLIIIQCRLQDCWEIFKQPGVREEFAMECLLGDIRR